MKYASHEQDDFEKVVKHDGFSIVEKSEEPPPANGIVNLRDPSEGIEMAMVEPGHSDVR
jgi:hypothetical protein